MSTDNEKAVRTITVVLTGVAGGKAGGRQTRIVDATHGLDEFLAKYGTPKPVAAEKHLTQAEMAEMAKCDPVGFKAYMAKMTSSFLTGSAKKSQPEEIVDAVCAYLVKDHNFLISDKDPGDSRYYVSRADIQPSVVQIPGDGESWFVTAAAPFG